MNYKTMASTIFFGNGVNLLCKEGKSWDNVLRQISQRQVLPPIGNNTLKYEYVVLPKERYTEVNHGFEITINGIPEPLELIDTEELIKEELAKELSRNKASYFYNKLAELEADNYITTNYESFLNSPLKELGYNVKESEGIIHILKPHYTFFNNNHRICFWNIHGNVELEQTIMLGLYDYSKSVIGIDKIMRAIEKDNPNIDESSWPFVMLHTDVHILGFGLGYEETDLWYFLTCRKRLIRKNKMQRNRIVYYAIMDNSYDMGKVKLLEALDVDVVNINFDWSEKAYEKAYDDIYNSIRNQIRSVIEK